MIKGATLSCKGNSALICSGSWAATWDHLVCRYPFHVIRLSVDRLRKIYGSELKCTHVWEGGMGWRLRWGRTGDRQHLGMAVNSIGQSLPHFLPPSLLSPFLFPSLVILSYTCSLVLFHAFRFFNNCYSKLKYKLSLHKEAPNFLLRLLECF